MQILKLEITEVDCDETVEGLENKDKYVNIDMGLNKEATLVQQTLLVDE